MNIFDLVNQDMSAATVRVVLGKDPATGEEFGLHCVGMDSPQWHTELDRQRVDGMRYVREHGRIDTSTEDGARTQEQRMNAGKVNQAVAVTVGWFGFTNDGEPAMFDPSVVRQMLAPRMTWVDEIFARISNTAAFFPQPTSGS